MALNIENIPIESIESRELLVAHIKILGNDPKILEDLTNALDYVLKEYIDIFIVQRSKSQESHGTRVWCELYTKDEKLASEIADLFDEEVQCWGFGPQIFLPNHFNSEVIEKLRE